MAGKKAKTRTARAGIVMPVPRVARVMKTGKYAERFGRTAPVFMAGVLDYLVAELVDLSGAIAKSSKKKRITPRAVNLAIRSDADMNALLGDALVSGGGVLPHINKVLLKGKKKKRSKKKKAKKVKAAKSGSPKKKKKSSGKKSKAKKSKGKKKSGGKKKSKGKKSKSKKSKK
eukprot:894369_1